MKKLWAPKGLPPALPVVKKVKTKGGLQINSQIQLVDGEIAKQQADVLVNTTGTDVNLLAGTVSYTFLEAGGKELQDELTRACPSGLKVGGVAQTTGGTLQCQKVFHVVLKQWMNKNDEAEQILKDVVTKCLEMASKQNFQSIALPALGAGFQRFPGTRSADIMFTATETFLQNNKGSTLKTVKFVFHRGDDMLRKDFEARRDGVSVVHESRVNKEIVLKKTAGTKELTIRAITGDLTQLEVDVLVNTTQTDLDLSVGAVSGSLLNAGGQVLQDECRQQHPLGAKPGTVVQTGGGKLTCKKVFHVILKDWSDGDEKAEKTFLAVVTTSLQEASRQQFTSIGFPVLGTGYAGFPAEKSTILMMKAFVNFFQCTAYTSLRVLSVVVHPKDSAIKKIVEDQVGEGERLASMAKFIIKADGTQLPVGEETHVVAGQVVGQKDLLPRAACVSGEEEAMAGTEVKYKKLKCGDRYDMTPDDYHYRLVESQFHRYLSKDKVNRHIFQITQVVYVVNPKQKEVFSVAQARMPKQQPVLAFYGTAKENIKSICQDGFQQPCFGNTVSFSEYPLVSMKSMQKSNVLLICKILRANGQTIDLGTDKPDSYSLVHSPDKALVMHKEDYLLPCYIVYFGIVKRFRLKEDPANVLKTADPLASPVAVAQNHTGTKQAAQPTVATPVAGMSTVSVPKMVLLMKTEPMELILGDISHEQVDVIVSIIGTDGKFLPGSVTSPEAGGKGLQEELTKAYPSGLQVGAIGQTKGGTLQCKRVFHVVLRQWMNPNDAAEKVLKTVVTNCLEMASKKQFKSIAFPALGSGLHRFPGKRSADIMFTAVESYIQKHKGTSIKSIKIVLQTSSDVLLRKDFEGRMGKRPVVHGNTVSKEVVLKKQVGASKVLTVRAIVGDLAQLTDDVLVNTTQTDLNLSIGAVSNSLLNTGGPVLQTECKQQHPQGVKPGTVVQTQGGKLKCKKVFHTVLEEWAKKSEKTEKAFLSVVTTCLQEASRHKLKSIAFPVLGTGYAGYPAETSARLMMKAVLDFFNKSSETSLEVISIVVHYKDEVVRKIVESQVEESEQLLNKAKYIVQADGSKVAVTGSTHVVAGLVVRQKDLFSRASYVTGERKALGGSEVKYFELKPEPRCSMTPEDYHYRLVESQFYRYLSKDTVNRHIFQLTKVEYVVNPKQVKQFRSAQEKMFQKDASYGVPVLGFHGTSEENIKSICEEGFRQPDHPFFEETTDVGWYGNGIYFSEYPRFAMNYMQKTSKLLMCKVLKGKTLACKKLKLGAAKEPGYDCHVDPYGREIVIFEEDCILPCYILHFNICKRFKFKEDKKSSNDNDDTEIEYLGEMEMHKGELFPGF
ncbi:uncharacterized protein LOC124111846 [Haliotis rufescens]|uniref:uncharacterized protein LOC124111846 n=1 Tax=Haliotis rufescens TaxID=6454 RepID=UPI00201F998D|nr:uncharacterized protein LOC124111846 [Haliotis rufescens]XP_048239689.1 uncharacterized protein LOC124111846 [Haliotis rufescens]